MSIFNFIQNTGKNVVQGAEKGAQGIFKFLGDTANKAYNMPINVPGTNVSAHEIVNQIPQAFSTFNQNVASPVLTGATRSAADIPSNIATTIGKVATLGTQNQSLDKRNAETHQGIQDFLSNIGIKEKDNSLAQKVGRGAITAASIVGQLPIGAGVGSYAEGLAKAGIGLKSLNALKAVGDSNPTIARNLVNLITPVGTGSKTLITGAKLAGEGLGFGAAQNAIEGKSPTDIAKSTALNTAGGVLLHDAGVLAKPVALKVKNALQDFIQTGKAEGVAQDILQKTKDAWNNSPLGNEHGYIGGTSASGFEDALKSNAVTKGVDGKPKFEVDDSTATYNTKPLKEQQLAAVPDKKIVTLDEVLKHSNLFEDYPQLKNIHVTLRNDLGPALKGSYNRNDNSITLNANDSPTKQFSTLLHETQHAIQHIEGHATGGDLNVANKVIGSLDNPGLNDTPFNVYRRFAGEAEARNVADRQHLSADRREQLPFNKTFDVKPQDQIVHFDSPQSASIGISKGEFDKALTSKVPKPKTEETPNELSPKSQALLDSLSSSKPSGAEMATGKTPQQVVQEAADTVKANSKAKVNLADMLRTPEKVLHKIGLGKESDLLRASYDQYTHDLPKELDVIGKWHKQLSPQENQNVFKALDGQDVSLTPKETQIKDEIKTYLKGWAAKLGLPEDKQISSYITHIFDTNVSKNEFDPDIAKLIQDKVPGSIYDPFLQKRLGAKGYKEDVVSALDAYVKRAVRKVNLDPALQRISDKADKLEISQYNYVKKYIDRVNMRPTEVDTLADNFIKASPIGYKLGARPTTVITKGIRQAIYRGTLGLNPGSALKNLSQASNTYAKLGEKYTVIGYSKLVKSLVSKDPELNEVGVLSNSYANDRAMSAKKKVGEKIDKGLFGLFDFAERINRGAAYFGAKSKALSQGQSEEQAVASAKKLVRDTQFSFGTIDTPPVLSSDVAKLLLQFQSFNVKQTEFLGSMVKAKDIPGLVRWGASSLLFVATIGKALGMSPKDLIPFSGVLSGQNKIGDTPATKLAGAIGGAVTNAPDKYGNVPSSTGHRIAPIFKATVPLIPAGSQLKKTIEGLNAYSGGGSFTPSGQQRFSVDQTPQQLALAALLGQYGTSGGQQYIQNLSSGTPSSSGSSRGGSSGGRGSGSGGSRGGKKGGRGN